VASLFPHGTPLDFLGPAEEIDVRRRPVFADKAPLAAAGSEPRDGRGPPPEAIPKDERFVVRGAGWEHFLPLRTGRDET